MKEYILFSPVTNRYIRDLRKPPRKGANYTANKNDACRFDINTADVLAGENPDKNYQVIYYPPRRPAKRAA